MKTNKLLTTSTVVLLMISLLAGLGTYPARADSAGFALEFDGVNDHVLLGETNTVLEGADWTHTKTMSVWVRPDGSSSPSTSPTTGRLILGNDRPRLFGMTRANYNGQDRLWVWNAAAGNVISFIGITYTPGVWMHVALVHAGGTLSAYKNGELVGSVSSGATALPSGSNGGSLYLGGSARPDTATYWQGRMDEARFWNAALDQATLQGWMQQEANESHPNWGSLAAYYRMSDGSGVSLSDDSGHGHTGTLSGGMSDANWVVSDAFGDASPTSTPTVPVDTPTFTPVPPTATSTNPPPPTSTPTNTAVPPTATFTNTPAPPTATPTETIPPTPTDTPSGPTPTPTNTPVTPTPTDTIAPPSPTNTLVPPTPTDTSPPPTPTPTTSAGDAGYALDFDGESDFVELNYTELMLGTGWNDTKTISLWALPEGVAPACQDPAWCDAIFGDRPRWWGISRGVLGGMDRIWIWNFDNSSDSAIDIIGVPYTPGEWVHIALVHSGGILRAYKNGVQVGSTPSGATTQPFTGAYPVLHLGGIIQGISRNWTFEGQLDEVRMWNIALSQEDLQATMYTSISGNEAGLRAYYKMSDGAGITLTDDSGNGWNGTLYDGARGVPPSGAPAQWVFSTAFGGTPPPPTPTPTATVPGPTNTPTPTATLPGPTNTPAPTATATPVTPTPTPGEGGFALDFDGVNDHVQLSTTTNDLFSGTAWTTSKTLSLWVRPTGATSPATSPSGGQLLLGTDRPRSFGINRATYTGLDRIWVWNWDSSGQIAMIGIPFTPGEWMHIAMVHSGGALSAYKNGVLVGSTPSGATNLPSGTTGGVTYLGGSGRTDVSTYFVGQIDEVRLWTAGLSQAILQAWMNTTLNSSHPNWASLAAYYRMSNGSGTTLSDDSGHGKTGTLLGGMSDANWVSSTAYGPPYPP